MPWTTPETFTAGQTLTAASMNAISGNLTELAGIGNSAAWTAYTPTWTGLSVGNATQAASYTKVGRLVVARFYIKMGSTTTFSGTFTATLPVTAATYSATTTYIGHAIALDAGTSNYLAIVKLNSTTTMGFETINVAFTYAAFSGMSNTVPMTWTTNDELNGLIVYEAAS